MKIRASRHGVTTEKVKAMLVNRLSRSALRIRTRAVRHPPKPLSTLMLTRMQNVPGANPKSVSTVCVTVMLSALLPMKWIPAGWMKSGTRSALRFRSVSRTTTEGVNETVTPWN